METGDSSGKEISATRLSKPRVPLVDPEALQGEPREILDRSRIHGHTLNIFATLIHHPKLMKRWQVFGNHVLNKSTLPPRHRELLILRIGWLCRSEYEFGQHVVIGRQVGLSDGEVERITRGPEAEGWDAFDATLLRAADELHADAFLSNETWNQLAEQEIGFSSSDLREKWAVLAMPLPQDPVVSRGLGG